jgi:hypothetical protein
MRTFTTSTFGRRAIAALAVAACMVSRTSWAQGMDGDAQASGPVTANEEKQAIAAVLFKDARKLLEDGKIAEACRKFEESQRLDPGGGTLLNLAACHEREGKTASAWTEFSAALAQARKDGRADRAAVAEARVGVLEARLARVTIVVRSGAESADFAVRFDGVPVPRSAWGIAIPVDPGAHTAEAEAKGFLPWQGAVVVSGDGDAKTVEVPTLQPAPVLSAPPLLPVATEPPSPSRAGHLPLVVRDVLTGGAAALGIAGIVLGAHFGLHAISLEHQAQGECPAGRCTNDAASTSDRATTSADLSTGAFVVGAAGIGAAAFLLFTRGHAVPPVTAVVTPSGGSLLVTGRF